MKNYLEIETSPLLKLTSGDYNAKIYLFTIIILLVKLMYNFCN